MKGVFLFLSVIFGMTLFSHAAAAVCDSPFSLSITDPDEGATTNSTMFLKARTYRGENGVRDVDCQYTLDNSPVSYAMFRTPSGYTHNVTIYNIPNGQHTIRVNCIKTLTHCTYTANATVTIYGSASVPEFRRR